MEQDLLKIINNYGINNQLRKFTEEYFELTEAIINAENNRLIGISNEPSKIAIENITQEIADCMVLIEQFKLYYGITSEEITNIFWNKVARTLERIESGYYEK